MALAAACPPPCDRSTCTGCCDSAGECNGGANRNACGRNGTVCQSCGASARCQSGMCVPLPADAGSTLDGGMISLCGRGCRDDAQDCQPGNLPEACGGDGGTCVACTSSQRCELGRCVVSTCGGCVDAIGTCQPGSDALACGRAGTVCQACAPSERCTGQVCVAIACNSNTCPSGCCSAGVCLSQSVSACGTGGQACVACAVGQTCRSGLCR